MADAYICDCVRTPIGRYGGALTDVRTDDLGRASDARADGAQRAVDWDAVDDVIYGCANQAGEDNRNVARMAALLAGLPDDVPGATINRLCGSGLDAVGTAARAIRAGDAELVIAGGVESMTRAPFVMGKADRGLLALGGDLRHHDRLALRQPADEGAVRRRLDAGDGRERRRGLPGRRAPTRTPSRFARRCAPRRRRRAASSPARSRRWRSPAARARVTVGSRRASARRHHARGAGEAAGAVPQQGGTVTAGNASGVNDGAAR